MHTSTSKICSHCGCVDFTYTECNLDTCMKETYCLACGYLFITEPTLPMRLRDGIEIKWPKGL